jgi:hypothetical protein
MIRKFNKAIRIKDPFGVWFVTELAVCMTSAHRVYDNKTDIFQIV